MRELKGDALIAVAMSGRRGFVDSGRAAAAGGTQAGRHDRCSCGNQRRLPELLPESPTGRCCSLDDVHDARAVAHVLGYPLLRRELRGEFWRTVVQPFIEEYLAGRTPIPCTLCNNYVKFDRFLEMAEGVGASLHRDWALMRVSTSTTRRDGGKCAQEWMALRTRRIFCGA